MSTTKTEVIINGRKYDLDKLADAISIQAELVPENWKGAKSDCVRLMLTIQDMLSFHLKRHIAANWQHICKTIQENKEDGDGARLPLTFKFSIDQSVPTLAAISDHALNYSVKHGTTGKADTCDLTQGDFFGDISATVDASSIGRELTEEDEEQAKLDKEADKNLEKAAGEAEEPGTEADGTSRAESKPAGVKPKRVRNRKKKVAAPTGSGE